MKKLNYFRPVILLFLSLFIFSCASRKNVAYYQNIDQLVNLESSSSYETILQPDDLLMIVVMAENPEVAAPFNLPSVIMQSTTELENQQMRMNSYLIDSKGFIQFPVLGSIQIGGLTRTQAIAKITNELEKYIKKPSINLRILNYKVTVQGEVTQPGIHNITSERITLTEALSMSGDLTVYGKRDNILVIREVDGKKQATRVDITKADFLNSPFYYLKQNDVVYVEPNKTKVNSSVVGPNTAIVLSSISILVTIIALTIR
ncbi:polysaccharide biosynthesis/export family protein [Flavobacterium lindanitolerans]|uniref:Polysaccharide export outer membrane protein n=1 Tax=Flavobacterium lindanitolerans TaxID=428988 RepID=A0A497TZD1_9FLAO|nr:polysaccharide biosynthesis/export family protein [Flavobacterium lindanitolerans]MBC8643946.1 polysaccharide biosynthesis/export family protein [Flavobacterium lindanitolerans]PKW20282.1 polysaccharide export outer membrane protein [Flavobacterium lindanitolerans]RLJ23760.1 polysaccharide export outer membrane protein [Flavobacterium lindanitolerans]